jgi:hypothetical protein
MSTDARIALDTFGIWIRALANGNTDLSFPTPRDRPAKLLRVFGR